LSVENNVSLQDNSDDPKRIKSKWRYGMDETLNEIQSKTCPCDSLGREEIIGSFLCIRKIRYMNG
jgi:hypothetical protein